MAVKKSAAKSKIVKKARCCGKSAPKKETLKKAK